MAKLKDAKDMKVFSLYLCPVVAVKTNSQGEADKRVKVLFVTYDSSDTSNLANLLLGRASPDEP